MIELSEVMLRYDMTFKSSHPMTQLSLNFDQNVRGRIFCRLEHYHFEQNTTSAFKKSCKSHVMI